MGWYGHLTRFWEVGLDQNFSAPHVCNTQLMGRVLPLIHICLTLLCVCACTRMWLSMYEYIQKCVCVHFSFVCKSVHIDTYLYAYFSFYPPSPSPAHQRPMWFGTSSYWLYPTATWCVKTQLVSPLCQLSLLALQGRRISIRYKWKGICKHFNKLLQLLMFWWSHKRPKPKISNF